MFNGGLGVPNVDGFTLAIDFGTAHTVAAVRLPDGQASPLLFDATPLLRSAVHAGQGRRLLTGQDAVRAARIDPAGFEPYPKRHVDEPAVLLGTEEYPAAELIAAVLRRVADEARRVSAASVARTLLTHPASWGPQRRRVLLDAADRAGLGTVALMPEPFAAARFFARSVGRQVPAGSALVVYDLGAGTFDISVIRHRGDGTWDLVATDGLDDLGGLDLDAVVLDQVGGVAGGRDPARWQRLRHPTTVEERQQHQLLWDEARAAKEQLSRASVATLRLPWDGVEVHQTREEFEQAARPLLDRTVALTAATLFRSGIAADRVAGVLLVGGATRVPLVGTLLHQQLGIPPSVMDQPEQVVALGGLGSAIGRAEPTDLVRGGAAVHGRQPSPPPGGGAPAPSGPGGAVPPRPGALPPVARPRRRRPGWRAWTSMSAVVVVAVAAVLLVDNTPWSGRNPTDGRSPTTGVTGTDAVAATLGEPVRVTGATSGGTGSATVEVTLSGPTVSTMVELPGGKVGVPKQGRYLTFEVIIEVIDGVYHFNTLHFHLVPRAEVAGWREGGGGFEPEVVAGGFEPIVKSRRMSAGDRNSGNLVFDVPRSAVDDAAVVIESWLLTDGPAAAFWPVI
ncbi:Hsp70 family protein [Plantactinospora sp. B6F1]|uniref:Hsp70 family protein n=1 Tax=Plantactinospora sp. B6F1 TaxID=3158971 RepID=UPI0013EF2072